MTVNTGYNPGAKVAFNDARDTGANITLMVDNTQFIKQLLVNTIIYNLQVWELV